MDKVLELQRKRSDVLDGAAAVLQKAEDEKRATLTDGERKVYDDAIAEAKSIMEMANRHIEMNSLQGEVRAFYQKPAANQPDPQNSTPGSTFRSLDEYVEAVLRAGIPGGTVDNRLIPMDAETRAAGDGGAINVMADGGYLMQTEFSNDLIKRVYDNNQVISRCAKRPLKGPLEIPAIDETSRADGSRFGGVQMYWTGEESQITSSKPKFAKIKLEPHKLSGLYYATEEALEDIPFLTAEISDMFMQEADFKIQDAIVNGNGAGMPLGLMSSPALVTQGKETGQTATTIVSENLIKMRARMWARSWNNAVWLYNQDCFEQLVTLTYTIGTGGVMSNLFNLDRDTIMNKPAIPIEQAQTLGTAGDVILTDLSQYILGQRSGVQSATSIHLKFDYAQTAFRWIIRLDGQSRWKSALTPFKGSATQSPIVVCIARS